MKIKRPINRNEKKEELVLMACFFGTDCGGRCGDGSGAGSERAREQKKTGASGEETRR